MKLKTLITSGIVVVAGVAALSVFSLYKINNHLQELYSTQKSVDRNQKQLAQAPHNQNQGYGVQYATEAANTQALNDQAEINRLQNHINQEQAKLNQALSRQNQAQQRQLPSTKNQNSTKKSIKTRQQKHRSPVYAQHYVEPNSYVVTRHVHPMHKSYRAYRYRRPVYPVYQVHPQPHLQARIVINRHHGGRHHHHHAGHHHARRAHIAAHNRAAQIAADRQLAIQLQAAEIARAGF